MHLLFHSPGAYPRTGVVINVPSGLLVGGPHAVQCNFAAMSEQADAAGIEAVSVALRLTGEYDISRREELEEQLAAAHDADVAVLDLREVPYLDSSALSCFIKLRKRMMERGPGILRIAGANPQVRRIFTLTNLDRIFRIEE